MMYAHRTSRLRDGQRKVIASTTMIAKPITLLLHIMDTFSTPSDNGRECPIAVSFPVRILDPGMHPARRRGRRDWRASCARAAGRFVMCRLYGQPSPALEQGQLGSQGGAARGGRRPTCPPAKPPAGPRPGPAAGARSARRHGPHLYLSSTCGARHNDQARVAAAALAHLAGGDRSRSATPTRGPSGSRSARARPGPIGRAGQLVPRPAGPACRWAIRSWLAPAP